MTEHPMPCNEPRRCNRGFTLIELMVAMLLGLIVIAGVVSVFLANQQTYRTNEALGDVEDGSRIAFEMLARDIRDAGLTGCDTSNGRLSNVLSNGPNANGGTATDWYADWRNALHGYDNAGSIADPALTALPTSGATSPVVGNGSVQVISTGSLDVTIVTDPSPSAANFKINAATTQLSKGDVIMVCDFDHATLMQITDYTPPSVTVVHNSGTGSPGNCSKGLGYPTVCGGNANGANYTFPPNSRVSKLTAADWYIGNNPVGGTSLYRLAVVSSSSAGLTPTPEEMVRNVAAMQIAYLQPPNTTFGTATSVGSNWTAVDAAQITLTLQSTNQRAGVNAKPITRSFTSTTTVRNRVP